jgi:hypothetical protein
MTQWSLRKVFVLVLAFFVTVSMGLSAVQAATFMPQPARMTTMADMDSSSGHGCKQCIGDLGGKAMICAPVCFAIVATGEEITVLQLHQRGLSFTSLDRWLEGRSSVPDPYPPRTTHIV